MAKQQVKPNACAACGFTIAALVVFALVSPWLACKCAGSVEMMVKAEVEHTRAYSTFRR
jgi:hypothetical protein